VGFRRAETCRDPGDVSAEIKNPALRSYLAILMRKGHVTRRRVGKAYYYRAKTRRQSTFRSMLRELVQVCCDGSVGTLLCHLIKAEKLTEEELLELKRLVEEEPPRGGPLEEPPERQS